MSHTKGFLKLEFLNRNRIIYRRNPITDKPTQTFYWGWNYLEAQLR